MTQSKSIVTRVMALMKQPLFANAGYLMGISLLGPAMGFVFWWLAARFYSPEDIGTASAVWAAIVLVSGIAGLGIDKGIVRFLPESEAPHGLLNTALTFSTLTALVTGGIYLAGSTAWSPSLALMQQNGLYVLFFLVLAVNETLRTVIRMSYVANQKAQYTLLLVSVLNGSRLAMVAVLAGLGATGLLGSMALASMVALVVGWFWFLPQVQSGYRIGLKWNWANLRVLIPYSIGNHLASLLAQISQTVLPILTLELLGPVSNGYAYIAWQLGWLLSSPGVSLGISAFAEASNDPKSLEVILARAATIGLALTAFVALAAGIAAPWLLGIFGASYVLEATGLLRWLALAAPLVVMTQLFFTYLRVRKQVKSLSLLSGMIAVVTVGVAALLMPRIGISGGGIGWLVSNSLAAAMALIVAMRGGVVKEMRILLGQVRKSSLSRE
jgi:O-antigen/teichoic acid export membrane protein